MSKILVVDDEHDMIWALTNVLLAENHSVVSVDSGEDALKKVSDNAIDLVLLDYRLPGMDGIQILEKIKQIKPELPVVMVTGYGGIEEAVQAIKLGAADYIPKPFDNDHLIEVVNKALQIDSLKKGGVFEKRVAEKIDIKNKEKRPSLSSLNQIQESERRTEEKPKRKSPLLICAFLFLLLLGGGALYYYARYRSQQKIEYLIPNSRVSGLSFGAGSLWVSDWFTQNIYQYQAQDKNLALIKSYTFAGMHLTGIALGKNCLYTCDSWKKKIYKHYLDGNLTIAESVDSPGPNPSALYFDGKYLWSADATNKKIYQHATNDKLSILATHESPGVFPVGIYLDKKFFWTASATGMKVFKNSLGEKFALEKTYVLPESQDSSKQISAFTIQGKRIYYTFEGTNNIFSRHIKDLIEVGK